MKRSSIFLLILIFLIPLASVSAATLENKDLQSHQLEIRSVGQFYVYTIPEQARVSGICEYGCEMVLLSTGQTIRFSPNDIIVIEHGTMQVMTGDSQ